MLSRVAERVYWAARYLERIENTARLIDVYDKLIFDLPKNVNIGWYNLITLNSAEEAFEERYKVQDERNVVKFLLGDKSNFSSITSCLNMARENLRTTRDVVPAESWVMINELNLFSVENLQKGINRSERFYFLDGVIKGCQQIQGLLHVTMPHDAAWHFMRLGRNIERADMTTRILDAGVRAQMQVLEEGDGIHINQIIWGNVLRSLGAGESYRRALRSRVSSSLVAQYIMEDENYPRTIAHCFQSMTETVERFPNNDAVLTQLKKSKKKVFGNLDYSDLGEPMKDILNNLQLDLGVIHTSVSENWFTI
jgi:uncharacterized alpha-E superfamily protein